MPTSTNVTLANFNGNEFRGANGLPSNLSHDMNAYGTQQNQTSAAAPIVGNHYGYVHATGHSEMPQNIIKSEDANSSAYGRPTLPNVEGMSATQDNSLRWNSSFNGENQDNFIKVLGSTINDSIGSIVDADLAKVSAKLQALQIRQQLGTQTLSIANQSPSILLSLFK